MILPCRPPDIPFLTPKKEGGEKGIHYRPHLEKDLGRRGRRKVDISNLKCGIEMVVSSRLDAKFSFEKCCPSWGPKFLKATVLPN